ncbi:hypothetical protein C8F04DRAFT_1089928 [Mycena alexandri]|uniref:Uncharacterized protein n=1 Tax=Mycena alexandri TaxID=1745969 RepID=A0AAD6T4C2_9AGAR|nr:hypothetical protein C8F04DRAFT_1089928 [Mycena alexandri]
MASASPLLPRRNPSNEDVPLATSIIEDPDASERDMSEQQLRELYDAEEIDRFLSLFSAYVTEVQLRDDTVRPTRHARMDSVVDVPNMGASTSTLPQHDNLDPIAVDGTAASRPSSPTFLAPSPIPSNISEAIAFRYLLPILPPSSPPLPLFTLGRLRLTTQRLYLAIRPAYGPFFTTLVDLATWKEKRTSMGYCIVFWILWYQNLLLPCLFLRILFALARRKIFSYPTLAQLRAHRQEIDRANEFGQEISTRFSASSSLGVKELWRIFKVFNKPKKAKVKKLAKDKKRNPAPPQDPLLDSDLGSEPEMSTVLDSEEAKDISNENDFKRAIVQTFAEIADLHERVKNIFIWRRPASSRIYGMVLLFLFIVTLLLPAKYLAKLTYFTGGFLFWHVTPVIAALPPSDRARLPPAFSDVPTDAEYAMELISQRVAAGLDVRPPRPARAKPRDKKKEPQEVKQAQTKDKEVDWKKWGERAAVGMTWAEDGKRIFTAGQWPQNTNRAAAASSPSVEAHTFPAQHTSAPGLITLTTDTFFFTPLMASTAKVEIPLASLRGVKKKSGLFTALTITWIDAEGVRKEEKFRWVGGRDELFARLISTADGKRWIA